ncbi:MAG: hypothetical protein CMP59_02430 [Flavobacteriales bacterium]|nr:hypothetical protein [Flavobacteriales bacterium]
MFYLYALTSIFVAWIWVDYFRLVDIYDRDSLKNLIITFFLGGISVPLVFLAHDLFIDQLGFGITGGFLNDLLFCILQVGLLEELCKLLAFLLVWRIFRKQINEPIDLIAYMSVTALGFAAIENTLYFSSYGSLIISGRAVLSTVAHMFFASLTAYGLLRWKFLKHYGVGHFILFFGLAAISHGLYDFFLMHEGVRAIGYLITVFFFLEGVSVFAVIINNALNNSKFFTHKKVIDNEKVSLRILIYYALVFVFQFLLISLEKGFNGALESIGISTVLTLTIVVIISLRMSRFKLIPGRWNPISFELPFQIKREKEPSGKKSWLKIRVKGEAYNEVYLSKFHHENFWLCPIGAKNEYLDEPRLCYIAEKLFLKNDETYYLAKIYLDDNYQRWEYILLKPKLKGKKFTEQRSPILAVLSKADFTDLSDSTLELKDFSLMGWAYPKAYDKWEKKRA